MADWVETAFPDRIRRIGGWRQHSNGDMHEKGRAIDIFADAATMNEVAYYLKAHVPNSRAIIHAGCGEACSILNGQPYSYPRDMAAHHDHVHWDINQLADLGGAAAPAAAADPAPAAADAKTSPWVALVLIAGFGLIVAMLGGWVVGLPMGGRKA